MRVVGVLLALAGVALADPVTDAADKALEVFRAKGDLKELAAADDPDPWLVADELCARGEFDAAEAFAKAAARSVVERLPQYVAGQRGQPTTPGARQRIATAAMALEKGDATGALDAATVGDDGTGVVRVRLLTTRALAVCRLCRWEDGVRALRKAAEAARELGWFAREARLVLEIGAEARRYGALDESLARYSEALGLAEMHRDDQGIAGALTAILELHVDRGERAEVDRCVPLALAALQRVGDPDAARGYFNLAVVCERLGERSAAMDHCARSLRFAERGYNHAFAARVLAKLGGLQAAGGQFGPSRESLERARRMSKESGDRPLLAQTTHALGTVQAKLGANAKALTLLEEALDLQRTLGDRQGMADTTGALAAVHCALGDYPRALAMAEQALEIQDRAGNRRASMMCLNNIAAIHGAMHNQARAMECFEKARKLADEVGDRAGAADIAVNIAVLRQLDGDTDRALDTYEAALAFYEGIGDRDNAAFVVWQMGKARFDRGDLAGALSCFDKVLASPDVRPDIGARALWGRGAALLASGKAQAATASLRQAVQMLGRVVEGLGDEEGARARETWWRVFADGLLASQALGDPALAWFFADSGRAITLAESLALRGRVGAALIPPDLCRLQAEARGHEEAALLAYRRSLDSGENSKALWNEVEVARAEAAAALQRIQREAKAQAALLYPEVDSLAAMQATLKPAEALVAYGLLPEQESLAVVIRADSARVVGLGETAQIIETVEAFQRAVARPDERGVAAPPHERLPFLRDRLAKLLVEPLTLDEKTTRLLISPDGLLAYVPFSVLTDRQVVYVPSGTTYRLLLEERGRGGEKVLAIGDPDYSGADKTAVSIYAGDEGLEQLPGTRAEAQAIGDVVLLGKHATRAAFAEALGTQPRWRAVHFACHGSVDPERPVLSSLALTAEGEDDGFLKCLDVYQMRIPADLVVLSACETGKGRIYRAEGVIGFTRAFMFAGAPRVIVSLWKVDDAATRALMEKFYEAWKPGKLGAAAALRAAQEHVRSQEKWKHPYFWAAWQLWGLGD